MPDGSSSAIASSRSMPSSTKCSRVKYPVAIQAAINARLGLSDSSDNIEYVYVFICVYIYIYTAYVSFVYRKNTLLLQITCVSQTFE